MGFGHGRSDSSIDHFGDLVIIAPDTCATLVDTVETSNTILDICTLRGHANATEAVGKSAVFNDRSNVVREGHGKASLGDIQIITSLYDSQEQSFI